MILLAFNKHAHKGETVCKACIFARKTLLESVCEWRSKPNKKEVVTSCFTTCTLAQYPATADNVQFDLLCCQPWPVPETLSTRPPCFTTKCPCGLPAWLGRAINTHDPGKCNLILLPISKVTGMSPMLIWVLTSAIRNMTLLWEPTLQPKPCLIA